MDILEHLAEEHRHVEKLIGELETSTSTGERVRILADLGESLAKHMDVEEERLYPIVARRLGSERAEAATAEHDAARDDLARLVDREDDAGFADAVVRFKADMSRHVREEENDIFPRLRTDAAAEIDALGNLHRLEDEVQQELTDDTLTR